MKNIHLMLWWLYTYLKNEQQNIPTTYHQYLQVDHDNVIDIVSVILPVVLVKPMIGATTCMNQIFSLAHGSTQSVISIIFEPVIPRGIGIVARIHPTWMRIPHFTQFDSNPFSIAKNISTPSSKDNHRLHGTDGLTK